MLKLKIIILFSIANCLTTKAQQNNPFAWLNGTWKLSLGKNAIVEKWVIVNDSLMQGKSFFVQNQKDSALEETIELKKLHGSWFYIPTTVNQNGGKPVEFDIIFHKKQEFIAVNEKHDFPKRIAYRLISKNLFASIEGNQKDSYSKKNFDYVAVE